VRHEFARDQQKQDVIDVPQETRTWPYRCMPVNECKGDLLPKNKKTAQPKSHRAAEAIQWNPVLSQVHYSQFDVRGFP
jgi:hypothetical protein